MFSSLSKKWNNLSPKAQNAFKVASEIVDQLTKVTNSTEAKVIVSLLLPKIGPIAFETLKNYLPQIGIVLGVGKTITVENSIEENILLISTYLKQKKGIVWASNADQLYKIFAVAFADNEISFSEAQLIGKWVYDNIILEERK